MDRAAINPVGRGMADGTGPGTADPRTGELAGSLAAVRARIAAAASAAGRDPAGITLIAVTKFFPAADVARLAGLGITDVGENREQEAAAKRADVAELTTLATRTGVLPADTRTQLRWHMVGQLQTNKVRAVLGWADSVQSVDRPKLVRALSRAAESADREVDCLIQVDLDQAGRAAGRGGTDAASVPALAALVADAPALRLQGLMAVAPAGMDPVPAFRLLSRVQRQVLREHPGATWLSAGMSADLEQAVDVGATHVRVGSALLGPRPELG